MKRVNILAALTFATLLAGCASPARVDQMVASRTATIQPPSSEQLRANVAVRDVTGGKETNPMWVSNVSSSEFERALEQSLRNAGLLSENRQAGGYFIVADLQKLDQPFIGASMTVTATVRYSVVERATGKDVYAKSVVTPYTAKWNDAFLGTERLRLANEGAMKANIAQLIDDLLRLQIASVGSR